jgi:hypothetical protein
MLSLLHPKKGQLGADLTCQPTCCDNPNKASGRFFFSFFNFLKISGFRKQILKSDELHYFKPNKCVLVSPGVKFTAFIK